MSNTSKHTPTPLHTDQCQTYNEKLVEAIQTINDITHNIEDDNIFDSLNTIQRICDRMREMSDTKKVKWFTVIDKMHDPSEYGIVETRIHQSPDVECNHPDFGKCDGCETVWTVVSDDIVAAYHARTLGEYDLENAVIESLTEKGYNFDAEHAPKW